MEVWEINGPVSLEARGEKFYIHTFTEGAGTISWNGGTDAVKAGESLLIPASLGKYGLDGHLKGIRAFIPDLNEDVIRELKEADYSEDEIFREVAGLA